MLQLLGLKLLILFLKLKMLSSAYRLAHQGDAHEHLAVGKL